MAIRPSSLTTKLGSTSSSARFMATPVVREWLANWSLEPDEQEEIGRNRIVAWNGAASLWAIYVPPPPVLARGQRRDGWFAAV